MVGRVGSWGCRESLARWVPLLSFTCVLVELASWLVALTGVCTRRSPVPPCSMVWRSLLGGIALVYRGSLGVAVSAAAMCLLPSQLGEWVQVRWSVVCRRVAPSVAAHPSGVVVEPHGEDRTVVKSVDDR